MKDSTAEVSLEIKPTKMRSWRRFVEVLVLSVCSLVYALTVILNALSYSRDAKSIGLPRSVLEATTQLYTAFTPSSPVFLMWILVYVWNGAWILYAWSFVFRPDKKRTIHELAFVFFTFAICFNAAWNVFWTQLSSPVALGFIIVVLVALYLCIVTIAYPLYQNTGQLLVEQNFDVWATRVLALNGLALYSTWIEVVLLMNLSSSLLYSGGVSNETSTLVSLSLLLALFLVYFVAEQTFLDRFGRHVIADYLIYPWAMLWIVVEQSNSQFLLSTTVSAYSTTVMVLAFIVLAAKVVLNVVYVCLRPIKYPTMEGDGSEITDSKN